MSKKADEYWHRYYTDMKNVGSDSYQRNVGRTKKGQAINEADWQKTLNYICNLVAVDESSSVIELCCGNGEVIGNLKPRPAKAVGVDYSEPLLEQLKEKYGKWVGVVNSDALNVKFAEGSADIVIIYAGIQYFNEHDSIQLIKNCLSWLKNGGRLLLGDIPDELRKWRYVDKPEYRSDYIARSLADKPLIGNWYHPDFFNALGNYFGNITVEVIDQPDYQLNSSYRYDVLIKKTKLA